MGVLIVLKQDLSRTGLTQLQLCMFPESASYLNSSCNCLACVGNLVADAVMLNFDLLASACCALSCTRKPGVQGRAKQGRAGWGRTGQKLHLSGQKLHLSGQKLHLSERSCIYQACSVWH